MDKLIPRREVLKILGVHYQTLNNMAHRKEIELIKIGKKRFYNLDKYLREKGINKIVATRQICYCRVSSNKQKEDLGRQIKQMKIIYPSYEIITDIGSGLNFNRVGLIRIIDSAIKGELKELVIAYKDRLARIGYDLIEMIVNKYSNGVITILNKNEEETPQEELTKDIITIMNVYVAKINGLRKYKAPIKKEINKKYKKPKKV